MNKIININFQKLKTITIESDDMTAKKGDYYKLTYKDKTYTFQTIGIEITKDLDIFLTLIIAQNWRNSLSNEPTKILLEIIEKEVIKLQI